MGILSRFSLLASTSECLEFAALQLLKFLPFSPLLLPQAKFYIHRQWESWFLCELVFCGNSTLYRHWNVFCVNRWHSKRYYTINQGTDKRRDTNLKLLAWTRVILVSLGTDFLWKLDGVYRRWNIFCVNRWHSNWYYTINQETENHMDTTLIREIMRYHFH